MSISQKTATWDYRQTRSNRKKSHADSYRKKSDRDSAHHKSLTIQEGQTYLNGKN